MKKGMRAACVLLALSLAGSAQAARLHFGQTNYTVTAGGTFQALVYLDMNEASAGDQLPATGLFSMGVKVTMDPLKGTVQSTNDVVIPAAINTDGIGGPGKREAGSGFARAMGVIPGAAGYTNALLATVAIKAVLTGTYQLNLGFYDALRDNFVDNLGSKIDGQITNFVAATVQVEVAGAPEIRAVSQETGSVMRITFANTNFTALSLGVLSTTSLYPSAAWTTETAVVFKTNSPGWYQADLPQGGARCRYYRIQAMP